MALTDYYLSIDSKPKYEIVDHFEYTNLKHQTVGHYDYTQWITLTHLIPLFLKE